MVESARISVPAELTTEVRSQVAAVRALLPGWRYRGAQVSPFATVVAFDHPDGRVLRAEAHDEDIVVRDGSGQVVTTELDDEVTGALHRLVEVAETVAEVAAQEALNALVPSDPA